MTGSGLVDEQAARQQLCLAPPHRPALPCLQPCSDLAGIQAAKQAGKQRGAKVKATRKGNEERRK